MQVLAKVLDVTERMHKEKLVADVVLKSGNDVIQITLWNNEVQKGTHRKFKEAQGRDIYTDIGTEVFNGRLQHRLGMDAPIRVVPEKSQASQAK